MDKKIKIVMEPTIDLANMQRQLSSMQNIGQGFNQTAQSFNQQYSSPIQGHLLSQLGSIQREIIQNKIGIAGNNQQVSSALNQWDKTGLSQKQQKLVTDEITSLQKKNDLLKRTNDQLEKFQQMLEQGNRAASAGGYGGGQGGGDEPPPIPGQTPRKGGFSMSKMQIGKTAALAAMDVGLSAVSVIRAVDQFYANKPQDNLRPQGHIGARLKDTYNSSASMSSALWAPERSEAMKDAFKVYQNNMKWNTGRGGWINAAANLGTGVLGGAATGAVGGALIGGAVGVGVGAGPGALIGGAAGGMVGGFNSITNGISSGAYRGLLDPEGYAKTQASEMLDNFEKNALAAKTKDMKSMRKSLAEDTFNQQKQTDLQLQRRLGLSDEEFYRTGNSKIVDNQNPELLNLLGINNQNQSGKLEQKGFFSKFTEKGFKTEEALQQLNQFQSAGGNTNDATDSSILSLQMQRGLGIQNASSVMGRMSGQGIANSDEAYKKLLTEAVKTGMNISELGKMPAEMEKFTSSIAQQATLASGAGLSSVALDQYTKALGGDISMKSMAGADAALSEFRKNASETGGIREQIRWRQTQSEFEDNASETNYLSNKPLSDMSEAEIQMNAKAEGISVEEFKQKKTKVELRGQNTTGDTDRLQNEVLKRMKETGMSSEELMVNGTQEDAKMLKGYMAARGNEGNSTNTNVVSSSLNLQNAMRANEEKNTPETQKKVDELVEKASQAVRAADKESSNEATIQGEKYKLVGDHLDLFGQALDKGTTLMNMYADTLAKVFSGGKMNAESLVQVNENLARESLNITSDPLKQANTITVPAKPE